MHTGSTADTDSTAHTGSTACTGRGEPTRMAPTTEQRNVQKEDK